MFHKSFKRTTVPNWNLFSCFPSKEKWNFTLHKKFFWTTTLNWNLVSCFQSKERKNVFSDLCLFFNTIVTYNFFNTFYIDLHPILFSIKFRISFREFEFSCMYLEIWLNLNSINLSCMQCHSIFLFKHTLIFTKSIHFFHQLIDMCNNANLKSISMKHRRGRDAYDYPHTPILIKV
jgi:hypothetical protein